MRLEWDLEKLVYLWQPGPCLDTPSMAVLLQLSISFLLELIAVRLKSELGTINKILLMPHKHSTMFTEWTFKWYIHVHECITFMIQYIHAIHYNIELQMMKLGICISGKSLDVTRTYFPGNMNMYKCERLDGWFNPQLLSTRWSVLEKDAATRVAPGDCSTAVWHIVKHFGHYQGRKALRKSSGLS